MSNDGAFTTAVLTTGEMYEGNQQFKGMGDQKWCLFCKVHRMPGGGHMRKLFGSMHWVCADHPKKVVKK